MNDHQYIAYFTRHFRSDLRDRLRVVAAQRSAGLTRVSMEDVLNEALDVGLTIMEAKKKVVLLD